MPLSEQPIALAITGASGSVYGLRLLESLLDSGKQVYLMMSQPGQLVVRMETELEVPSQPRDAEVFFTEYFGAGPDQLRVFGRQQWLAPVASGTSPPSAMVVCPCTTGTLASIASGACNDLIDRAADVVLKEKRKLILVIRETPLSEIHLENMLKLTRLGVVVMPASPGFYFNPASVEELVDFMVARVLDHLEIDHNLTPRWGEES